MRSAAAAAVAAVCGVCVGFTSTSACAAQWALKINWNAAAIVAGLWSIPWHLRRLLLLPLLVKLPLVLLINTSSILLIIEATEVEKAARTPAKTVKSTAQEKKQFFQVALLTRGKNYSTPKNNTGNTEKPDIWYPKNNTASWHQGLHQHRPLCSPPSTSSHPPHCPCQQKIRLCRSKGTRCISSCCVACAGHKAFHPAP